MEPERGSDVRTSVRTRNWTISLLVGALVILAAAITYFATMKNSEQDKLTQNQIVQSEQQSKAAPVEKLCAHNETYDLIKRELFRRAAQLRGSDQAAFDQLSTYAVVRMDNPVMESESSATGAVNCSGTLTLDLPPGVAVVGGHHSLSSDVDYTIQQAADGSGTVIVLRNADSIIAPLATLARSGTGSAAVAPQGTGSPTGNGAAAAAPPNSTQPLVQRLSPERPSPPLSQAPVPTAVHPGFDCAKARGRGELSVCSNAGLAALDRNMTVQLSEALAQATPQQRALLESTRSRFVTYIDRCPNRPCIASAYVGRMREIRDIMEGAWPAPR